MKIQFSSRDLLIATMLIGVGIGMLIATLKNPFSLGDPTENAGAFLYVFSGPAMLGAGLGWPFKHPWIGAVIAALPMLFFVYCLIIC